MLVGTLLVTSLHTVSFVSSARNRQQDASTAALISQQLMTEFSSQPFRDPTDNADALGKNSGESDRYSFDDFDDYDGWSAEAISSYAGLPLPLASGWSASVSVEYVSEEDMQSSVSSTELKKLTLVLASPRGRQFAFHCLRHLRGVSMQALPYPALGGVQIKYSGEQRSGIAMPRCINRPEVP